MQANSGIPRIERTQKLKKVTTVPLATSSVLHLLALQHKNLALAVKDTCRESVYERKEL